VWCMSAIEYNAKQAIACYRQVLGSNTEPRYLRDAISASADAGLIDEAHRNLWLGANTIRNRLVHNNGFGGAAASWTFSPDLTVAMEKGKMMTGSIMTFPRLTDWLITAYADWCDAFLKRT
jgi:hypothetical protein